MTGNRRPTAIEPLGEIARGHRAATRVEHEQQVPAGLVRQRAEDRFDVVELGEAARLDQTKTSGSAK
jgi:hypothetical protein